MRGAVVTKTAHRRVLTDMFSAAIAAAQPEKVLVQHLPEPPEGRTVVIGAGKGSAQMAQALERVWNGPLEGLVVTRYGYGCTTDTIEIVEAAHPVPDAAGADAAQRLLKLVQGLTEDDLVIALISGGGSALLPAPVAGMELEDEIALNETLLASGAPITAMNAIRKQFSMIKGGRLAKACFPARVVSLIVSDIPGDDPAMVASGPTVPDTVSRAEARDLVELYNIDLPKAARQVLDSHAHLPPLPDDPAFARNTISVIASARLSLEAAAEIANANGYPAVILSDAIEGEAREIAKMHAALARQVISDNPLFKVPVVLLSGGETTVTISGEGGRGGRNSEFLLSLALGIEGAENITALAADTDGIDGSEDNAGAFADGQSTARMRTAGVDPRAALGRHDAYGAFAAVDDLFVTGPTGTNVNDFRAILIG